MAEPLTHRQNAVASFNQAWALLEAERDPAGDLDLITAALTSRYHWLLAGGAEEAVISDWMCSRCCSAVGDGGLAVRYAESALARVTDDAPPWLRASAHEGMARAWAAAGERDQRAAHLDRARAALALETDPEDAKVVLAQIDDVPFVPHVD